MPHCLHVYSRKQPVLTAASIRQSAALWDRLCSTQCGWDTCRLRTWGAAAGHMCGLPPLERFHPSMAETKQEGPRLSRDVEGCPFAACGGSRSALLVVCPVGGRGTAPQRRGGTQSLPEAGFRRSRVHWARHQASGARSAGCSRLAPVRQRWPPRAGSRLHTAGCKCSSLAALT